MLGIYLLGIVGLDVHSCLSSGKSFVVSLWGGIECSDIHPESDCASLCCSHCHHAAPQAACTSHETAGHCPHCAEKAATTSGNEAGSACTHSAVSDDCCSDSCHYLALTGASSDHDELLAQIVCPEIDLPTAITPATEGSEAETSAHALLTPPDPGLSSPDILALISSYRI